MRKIFRRIRGIGTRLAEPVARFAARLKNDAGGAVVIYLAVTAIPTVAILGFAVDTTRAYLVKSQLSQALDASVLAGGKVIFSQNLNSDIAMYFNANFPQNFMGATVTGPTWNSDPDTGIINITASAVVPTTFLRVIGKDQMTVEAQAQVTRATVQLDLVLAMDLSGSMSGSAAGGGTRIDAARNAALELVSILFGTNSTNSLLNIGLVPWNSKVNVSVDGTAFDPTLTTAVVVPPFTNPVTGAIQDQLYYANNSPVPLLNPPAADWKGCVYARYLHDGNPDDDADDKLYSFEDLVSGTQWYAWQPIGPEGEPVAGPWDSCAMGLDFAWPQWPIECVPCLEHGITPMTNTRSDIEAAINALTSPNGSTDIPQGLAWAWRVLMPGQPFNQANPNPVGPRERAIVLLTDGSNVGGYGDAYKTNAHDPNSFPLGSAARPQLDARTLAVADAIKAMGIKIYTIQFAIDTPEAAALLKAVASSPNAPFYHFAPDVASLRAAFQEVANNLSELRLSM